MIEHLKLIILAILTSLLLTFFTGTLYTGNGDIPRSYSNESWYYINRGIPTAWAGVGLVGTKIYLPLIKAPFLKLNTKHNKFYKIINIKIFSALLLKNTFVLLTISYLFKILFQKFKFAQHNKHLNYMIAMLFVLNLIVYFKIFIRI